MPNAELQTDDIVLHALRSGKHVFVPFITRSPPVMDMLQLRDEEDFRSLKPDKWGIPSLDAQTVNERINYLGFKGLKEQNATSQHSGILDLVLMPAVAFDQEFERLGHGKGYYDRFLTSYCERVHGDGSSFRLPYLIGMALNEQILHAPHKLPAESWDVKVDAILVAGDFRSRS